MRGGMSASDISGAITVIAVVIGLTCVSALLGWLSGRRKERQRKEWADILAAIEDLLVTIDATRDAFIAAGYPNDPHQHGAGNGEKHGG